MSASANAWLRRRGRHRVVWGTRASSDEAVVEPPRDTGRQLVTQGARSQMPRPRPSPDAWLRGDVRSTGVWNRLDTEVSW